MRRSLIGRLLDGLGGRSQSRVPWDLSTQLLTWARGDVWTLGHAIEGTFIAGGTGSGKSSGSGSELASAFLRQGCGGLVLTVKPDERANWERYAAAAGRSDDLCVFSPGGPWRFNFLDHANARAGGEGGLTETVVSVLSTVLEIAERGSSGGGGRDDESYWKRSNRQLMRNAIDLLSIASGRVSVPDLYRLVISAPTSRDELRSEDWKAKSFCFHCLAAADRAPKSAIQRSDFEIVADYFLVEFPNLSEKTRSVVVSTFTSMVDVLNRGVLRQHFCSDTNLVPEATAQGKIIVIDFPVKQFGEVGVFAQVLWKYAFQREIERRNILENPRPVFLWADEAQHFLTSYDMQFQTTCRSSRVATVLLTQNVSNVYAALGGNERGRVEAASLFANLNTKILHANTDPVTNEWAASIVGRSLQQFANGNTSSSSDDTSGTAFGLDWLGHSKNTSAGFSESYEWDLQPSTFLKLRTGGSANDWMVDGVVVQNGKTFASTGRNWLITSFEQAQRRKRRKR